MICNGIRIIWVWKHFVAQRLLYTKSCQMQDKPHGWYQICRHPKKFNVSSSVWISIFIIAISQRGDYCVLNLKESLPSQNGGKC